LIKFERHNDESGRFWDIIFEDWTLEKVYISRESIDVMNIPNIPYIEEFFNFVFDLDLKEINITIGEYEIKLSRGIWRDYWVFIVCKTEPVVTFL